jgi:hypothetical protein
MAFISGQSLLACYLSIPDASASLYFNKVSQLFSRPRRPGYDIVDCEFSEWSDSTRIFVVRHLAIVHAHGSCLFEQDVFSILVRARHGCEWTERVEEFRQPVLLERDAVRGSVRDATRTSELHARC